MKKFLLNYAAPALPLAMLGLPMYVYLPKVYADLPLIGLTVAGFTLLFARLFDLFTDPFIGWISDRFRSRIHPMFWISIGMPITIIGVWELFHPSPSTTPIELALLIIITYTGWTLISVPHYAWGAELAKNNSERQLLATWREGAVLTGALGALIAVALTQDSNPLHQLAIIISVCLPITWILLWFIPRINVEKVNKPVNKLFFFRIEKSMKQLVLLHFLNALAVGIPATLFLIYTETTLNLSQKQSGILLVVYFIAGLLALPLWLGIAKNIGEIKTWRWSVWLSALAFFPVITFQPGDYIYFLIVCVLTGATLGADIALPATIQARLANNESQRQQTPQEGTAFGAFGLAGKLALALAVGISLPLIQTLTDNGIQDPLPWMYALIPAILKIIVGITLFKWHDSLSQDNVKQEIANENQIIANRISSPINKRV